MDYINPISSTALPAAVVQQDLAVQKTRQLRKAAAERRNLAAESDQYEHSVENAEAIAPLSEELPRDDQGKNRKPKPQHVAADPDEPHLDVTA